MVAQSIEDDVYRHAAPFPLFVGASLLRALCAPVGADAIHYSNAALSAAPVFQNRCHVLPHLLTHVGCAVCDEGLSVRRFASCGPIRDRPYPTERIVSPIRLRLRSRQVRRRLCTALPPNHTIGELGAKVMHCKGYFAMEGARGNASANEAASNQCCARSC